MNKQEFLANLRKKISSLPKSEVEERLNFYSEMIDDRIEEGIEEEEAVLGIGNIEEIAAQILAETKTANTSKKNRTSKRDIKAWEVVLLALGAPIWLSLIIAFSAAALSLYVVIWSLIISLWAIEVAFVACAVGCVLAGILFGFTVNGITGLAVIGIGVVFAGLSIFMYFACKGATKATVSLTKKVALSIKNRIVKKENM